MRRLAISILSIFVVSVSSLALVPASARAAGADVVPGKRIRGTQCVLVANPTPENHTVCPMATFPADLDLSGVNLSYAELLGTNFTGVKMTEAKLVKANLQSTTLDDANLTSAQLNGTHMSSVTAKKTQLQHAVLVDAELSLAILIGSNLTGANLTSSPEVLQRLDEDPDTRSNTEKRFAYTQFDEANLSEANLSSTFLHMASFKRAIFNSTDVSYATFVGQDMMSPHPLIGADLTGIDLTTAKLSDPGDPDSRTTFSYTTDETNVSVGANLTQANLSDVNLAGQDLRATNLTKANLTRANLTAANLSRSQAPGATFDYANLTRANLRDTMCGHNVAPSGAAAAATPALPDLSRPRASFRFANLTNANLSNSHPVSNPQNATAAGVDFSHANMTGTILEGTNMTWARLYGADTTQLAPGTNLTGATYMPYQPIAAGYAHSCALEPSGRVYCWGMNQYGQLGNNTTRDSLTPVQVLGEGGSGTLGNITAIASGNSHSCALNTLGHVYCWGRNDKGQLGDNRGRSRQPVRVVGAGGTGFLDNITAISVGREHSCALNKSGNVYCWGTNTTGQLGNMFNLDRPYPWLVYVGRGPGPGECISGPFQGNEPPLNDIIAISANGDRSCALSRDGHVYCWGHATRMGDGPWDNFSPVQVVGVGGDGTLNNITAISVGAHHSCALNAMGHVYCWGEGTSGQLGDNTNTCTAYSPVQVLGVGGAGTLSNITTITASQDHSCALNTSGHVYCWGSNMRGQLGDNTGPVQLEVWQRLGCDCGALVPKQVVGAGGTGTLGNIKAIAAGIYHSCALDTSGHVYCWGENEFGQLGSGTTSSSASPVQVVGVGGTGRLKLW